MTPIKETFIPIHPATNVRMVRSESWMLSEQVSYEYLAKLDSDRLEVKGKAGTMESRKRQLEICMLHKKEIMNWVIRNEFKMPLGHFALWFYTAMPPSWRRWKREEKIYSAHQNTPDLDNYLKQLFDSVMPRKNRMAGEKGTDDRKIFCYASFKVWVPFEEAGMKIIEYGPAEFMEAFKHGHPSYNKKTP